MCTGEVGGGASPGMRTAQESVSTSGCHRSSLAGRAATSAGGPSAAGSAVPAIATRPSARNPATAHLATAHPAAGRTVGVPPTGRESAVTASLAALRARLSVLMLRDQHRLARRADRIAAMRDAAAREQAVAELAAEVTSAEQLVQKRRDAIPVITYPAELPVSQRKDELAAAIRDNQIVIIAGETGSGKTTLLPKICLEIGRGITGQIGHTQPRRIAARTVADRIAAELGTELGTAVGYKVRFADTSSDDTLVKVMTDGILLTEMQRDRQLRRYDTLIIDEAHERSLNIDFILGYLKQLLPRRPDLKVIITSATIDPDRFSHHFAGGESNKHSGDAPIIEVSGRTYPVEVRYRPLAGPASAGPPAAEPGSAGRPGA